MILTVDDAFSARGARCKTCNALLPDAVNRCPYCDGAAIETVSDVVGLAIEAALEQKAALEMVRSSSARRSMAQRAPIGALFRW